MSTLLRGIEADEAVRRLVWGVVVINEGGELRRADYKRWFQDAPLVKHVLGSVTEVVALLAHLRGTAPSGHFMPLDASHPPRPVALHFRPALGARAKAPNARLEGNDATKLLVRVYDAAEGGCAVPGNAYWLGHSSDSAGAALAASSTVAELHNPYINVFLARGVPDLE